MEVTSSHISTLRLAAQQLGHTACTTAADIVSWFGAVQGQEYAQTKWGLGLRLPHLADADIEQELADGKILRTHLLRPTWHFVNAEDIYWLLALTAPGVNAVNAFMYRKLELDLPVFNACNTIIGNLLQGNRQLTRNEISLVLSQHNIWAEGFRLSYIMMRAELDGIVCSGARRGNQFTYALLPEKVQPGSLPDRAEALAELTRRYFQSRGPATVKDFSTWSGLTMHECSQGIGMRPDLQKMRLDGNDYYCVPASWHDEARSASIHLLPVYDEYIMGYKDRSAMLRFKNSLKPAPTFRYNCMIIENGQVTGTWKRTVGQRRIDVYYDWFKRPAKAQQKQFDRAIERMEQFNTLPVNPVAAATNP